MLSRVKRVKVDITQPVLTINSPKNTIYGRKVPFNIIISEDVLLDYYDSSDSSWKKLCINCDDYGNSTKKKLFSKGDHNVDIIAEDEAGNRDTEGGITFTIS